MRLMFEKYVRLASVVSLLLLAACQTSNLSDVGSGPITLSPKIYGWFQAYVNKDPMVFAVSEDGKNAFYWWCIDATACPIRATERLNAIHRCETLYGGSKTPCHIFAVRDKIVWQNPGAWEPQSGSKTAAKKIAAKKTVSTPIVGETVSDSSDTEADDATTIPSLSSGESDAVLVEEGVNAVEDSQKTAVLNEDEVKQGASEPVAKEDAAVTGLKHPMDGAWSVKVQAVDLVASGSIFCSVGEHGEQDFVVSDGRFSVYIPSNKLGTMKLWGTMEYSGLAVVEAFFTANKTKFTLDLSSGSGSRTRPGSTGWCRNKYTFSRISG